MDGKIRRFHSSAFKAQVALAAIKEEKTIAELAGLYGVYATQITKWKKQALDSLRDKFSSKREKRVQEDWEHAEELYRQIGKQKVEIEFVGPYGCRIRFTRSSPVRLQLLAVLNLARLEIEYIFVSVLRPIPHYLQSIQ